LVGTDMPKELSVKLNDTYRSFKEFDMSALQPALQQVEGVIVGKDELLATVIEASGYTKWTISVADNDFDFSSFGVDVDEYVTYQCERSCRSRDDVYLVVIRCVRGHVVLTYMTDRAGEIVERLIKNENILMEVAKFFD